MQAERELTFDERSVRLSSSLADAVSLLRRFQVGHWADWLDRDRKRVEKGDYYGLVELLGAFGGMGSLNDLVIHPMNGHRIAETEVPDVNEALHRLRGLIYADATSMKRELDDDWRAE